MMSSLPPIAVLYQALDPPVFDGVQKPKKEGGYADSGADIAVALRTAGVDVITPESSPRPETDLDWVFPDHAEGISAALKAGAQVLWLNTVLFSGHPIEDFYATGIRLIGQDPKCVNDFDDKFFTAQFLSEKELAYPRLQRVDAQTDLNSIDLPFPMMLKPIRGRGSQGVLRIQDGTELREKILQLSAEKRFGSTFYVEEYLPGTEITISVLPPGKYKLNGNEVQKSKHWCLPPVLRYDHHEGVLPYSGKVAVEDNSRVLSSHERAQPAISEVMKTCALAAAHINARGLVRIDCRANKQGKYFMFDLNLKPNFTGPGRPHRTKASSLTTMAARQLGWTYFELALNVAAQFWSNPI